MVVNAFWMGVLMTIVGVIVLFLVIAFINVKRQETDEEIAGDMLMDENEFQTMLNKAVREALRENMFGKEVEDRDND